MGDKVELRYDRGGFVEYYTLYEGCDAVGEGQIHRASRVLPTLWGVEVYPPFRGKGYGRALTWKLVLAADSPQVALYVTADNLVALKLYRSMGFEIMRTASFSHYMLLDLHGMKPKSERGRP